ncbi:MAG: aminotransferase class III-fold pyridoxal phosphate-dependent enzyme [Sedimentisphaerales bacterium]
MNDAAFIEQMSKEVEKRNRFTPEEPHINCSFAILNAGYEKSELHIKKAYGCFVEDCSGNLYIDTAMGAGTHILGHAHPVVVREIRKQAAEGTLYMLPNTYTYEVGKLLSNALPHFHSFVFCNSGTEATIRATRIARAYTGRKKIAMFSGGWHGGNDMLLFEEDYSGDENRPALMFKSEGVPQEIMDMTLMLPYNNDAVFDLIEQHKNELAMVIIEPSQGSNPRDDVGEFLHKLRRVTAEHNILLCFDEIVTGFRIALGGCQEHYGVKADIATYGKTLGGGLPIGLVAGIKEVMGVVNDSGDKKPVFMGGTFSANPLVMHIAKAVLQYLIENRGTIYTHLNKNGRYIRDTINKFCVANQIPVRMTGIGSMSRMIFTDKPIKSRRERDRYEIDDALQKLFYSYLRFEKGVHISGNRIIFLSTAHRKKHIGKIVRSIIEALEYFGGHLNVFK